MKQRKASLKHHEKEEKEKIYMTEESILCCNLEFPTKLFTVKALSKANNKRTFEPKLQLRVSFNEMYIAHTELLHPRPHYRCNRSPAPDDEHA